MMKQKAGLGKKVSSIFDGVPLPNIVREAPQAPGHAPPPVAPSYRPDAAVAPRPMQTMPLPPKPAPAAMPPRMMPPQPPSRMPVPARSVAVAASANTVSGAAWQQLIYKMFFSGDSETDARNKKAAVMMGMLSVVLVVVVWQTGIFSGLSSKPVSPVATAVADSASNIAWTPPEPWPKEACDPMKLGSCGGIPPITPDKVRVTGIVVSDRSSVTITINNDKKIYYEGQKINGTDIIIVKIYPKEVGFSANGKSWKQQVE